MNRRSMLKLSTALTTALFCGFATAGSANAQTPPSPAGGGRTARAADVAPEKLAANPSADQSVSEIVVTGTRISGMSAEQLGSPVQSFDRDSILSAAPGGGKASDFLATLPQSVGVFRAGISSSFGSIEGNYGGGSANLRGLGSGATLTLLNGRRQTRFPIAQDGRVDSNSLVPSIAISRAEVLLDGGSAVYGTDAVAGVVNFVTRDDFQGFEVKSDLRGLPSGKTWNGTAGFIGGWQVGSDIHMTLSGEYFHQNGYTRGERGVIAGANFAHTTVGWPGNFAVPTRNAAGQLSSSARTLPDPLCGAIEASGQTTNSPSIGSDTFLSGGNCRYSIKYQNLVLDEDRLNLRGAADGHLTDDIKWNLALGYGKAAAYQYNTLTSQTLNPVRIPGTNPGNTFRAVNAGGQPLYAMPDPANPSAPLRNGAGAVVLTSDPTNPASGIAFNEDVTTTLRPFSSTNSDVKKYKSATETFRAEGGVDGNLTDSLHFDAFATYSRQRLNEEWPDLLLAPYVAALSGRGGANGNQYYNPFGNALNAQPGSRLYNDPALAETFVTTIKDQYTSSLVTGNLSIDGTLIDLPAGPVKFAVGGEFRRDSLKIDYDPRRHVGNVLGQQPLIDRDSSKSSDAYAAYSEFHVPILDTNFGKLSTSVAGRYESQNSNESFNPKIAATFEKDGNLLRASYSTGFLTPSLFQTFGARTGTAGITDPVTKTAYQVQTRNIGDSSLEPQTSRSYSVGGVVRPIAMLHLSLDYWNIRFKNLLTLPAVQSVINSGSPGVVRDPTTGVINVVNLAFFNAASIATDGLDFAADVKFPETSVGLFNASLKATRVLTYETRSTKSGTLNDGLGQDNRSFIGYPMPKWRVAGQVGYQRGDTSVGVNVRYVSALRVTSGALVDVANDQTLVDLTFSQVFPKAGLKVSIGSTNVFDDRANAVTAIPAEIFVQNTQNPFPRRLFITVDKRF